MEQVVASQPTLLKIRQSPPASTTVLANTAAEVFSYRFPEVRGHTDISSSSVNNGGHVVKIRIKPQDNNYGNLKTNASDLCDVTPCIRISVNSNSEMIQSPVSESFNKPSVDRANPYFFCGTFNCGNDMSSGQVSPSDTLDSGTCSDLDCTPPSLSKKKNSVSVTVIGEHHKRASSLGSSGTEVDSDDSESNVSCDSLNSNELPAAATTPMTPSPSELELPTHTNNNNNDTFLPQGLLQDIREQSLQLSQMLITNSELNGAAVLRNSPNLLKAIIDESTYEDRKKQANELGSNDQLASNLTYDTDKYYNFHIKEHEIINVPKITRVSKLNDEDTFAGYKDLLGTDSASTIRSAKGTIRGVKNRVRAGIATFLQINSITKSFKEKDAGKIVVYTTTMGIVRETYNNCMKVKQILRTLLVKFEERDVFMSCEFQGEIIERMRCDHILVPQVFVDGQHIGDAETVERLNETGELRRILKPYKSMDACTTCKVCGGYRLLPCQVCNGSKKSVHRNHFTAEFVALKCMNCDEVGLVRCSSC